MLLNKQALKEDNLLFRAQQAIPSLLVRQSLRRKSPSQTIYLEGVKSAFSWLLTSLCLMGIPEILILFISGMNVTINIFRLLEVQAVSYKIMIKISNSHFMGLVACCLETPNHPIVSHLMVISLSLRFKELKGL